MTAPPAAGTPSRTSETMAQRYGSRGTSRRQVRIVAIACAVVAAIGLGWVAWGMLAPSAEGDVSRFTVVDETSIDVVLEVTRPVGRTAVCTIEVLGDGFAQVGLADIRVEPAPTSVSVVQVPIATSAQATVAVVRSCSVD